MKPTRLKKLAGGISRYGLLRAAAGVGWMLRFKLLRQKSGSISTITDGLIINFDYPRQFIRTLAIFKELVEPEYEFLRRALRRDSVFFDVGGGIGNYSMCAAKIVDGPIHTF